jgi:hypothetical protein
MLNAYIRNNGLTQTLIKKNNRNHINQISWDADYNGDIANILVNTNENGKKDHYAFSLNNSDLEKLLNVSSVDAPLDSRLREDFYKLDFEDYDENGDKNDEELLKPLVVYQNLRHKTRKQRKNNHKPYRSKTKSKSKSNKSSRSKTPKSFTLF